MDVRAVLPEEFIEFITTLEVGAGRQLVESALADARQAHELSRTLAAFDDGRVVGGTCTDLLALTLPGLVPTSAARVMLTAVMPTHRGKGLMGELMRRLLRNLFDEGEALALATTHVPAILGRYGYGPADVAVGIELRTTPLFRASKHTRSPLRMLSKKEMSEVLPKVFDRHRAKQPGQVSRSDYFWRMWFEDRELFRIGTGERFAVVHESVDGVADGYLTYRLTSGPLREQPIKAMAIEDLIAVTDDARHALWNFCLTFDQAETASVANIPADDYVSWLLDDRALFKVTGLRDLLWVRLVNVAKALAARRYSREDRLVLEVSDSLITANSGRFMVDGGARSGIRVGTTDSADIAIGVAELASVYLGGFTFEALGRSHRIVELTPGAIHRADAMFATRPAPWTVTDW